jgi:hypothetical protein
MRHHALAWIPPAIILLCASVVFAGNAIGVYQTREDFLLDWLGTKQPESDVVWLDDALRDRAGKVLGHAPQMLRMRYWYAGGRSAWIIEEIGKHRPITFGIVIEDGALVALRVLQFRESRGWEIRNEFFTKQFSKLHLNGKEELSQRIDSISGATLSVHAATRSARFALVLNEYANTGK